MQIYKTLILPVLMFIQILTAWEFAISIFIILTSTIQQIQYITNMIDFIRQLFNYTEILNNIEVIDTWPLMGSPGPMLCIISTYLIFVLKVGPKMMEKKPPFQLKTVIILYNAFQVLFNTWLTYLIFSFIIKYKHLYFPYGCNFYSLHDAEAKRTQLVLLQGGYWYFFAKVIELLDTVFFVLRKKQYQVTFLHVYHHTLMATFSWCCLKLLLGEQAIVVGFLNSIVHVILYIYYFIAALGSKYRKYLWWKKYMTLIQLLQFALMLVYLMLTLAMNCQSSKILTYFFTMNVIIFIYLFSDFYRKSYKTKVQ
ncbi:very long chain fatty acid elongase 7-like isoform X1 [Anoplolepis gracilipes]|uniref:very long chain fatty acid elongase 7-like isoform X1 n=2 Tax=Anoplolepis gracilipes TaxID=354296 RepID=UPI003BA12E5B